jgi:hypothetical protein
VGDSYAPAPNGGDSGEPVLVGVSTPQVCTAADGVVSFTGAGSCVVVLSQAGTARYEPRTVRMTISVDKAWQSLAFASAAPVDAVVDDTYTPEVTGGASSAPVVVGSATPEVCTVDDGVVSFVGRGECELTADRDGDDNHVAADTVTQTVAVAGLPQVVVPTSEAPTDAVVGDSYTPEATGGDSGQPVLVKASPSEVCAATDGVVSFTGAGTCIVLLSQAGTARYAPAPAVTQTVEVGVPPTICQAVVGVSGSPRVVEGDAGTRAMVFPVTVGRPDGCGDLSLSVATTGGTARAGSDYVAPASSLVLPAGATSGELRVAVRGDKVDEPNETVRVALSKVTGEGTPSLGAASATGTIVDDDVVVAEPLAACRPGAAVPRGYTLVRGTGRADNLVGTSKNEIFRGGGGNDRIRGGAGNDILCGNAGRDVLDGRLGNDRLSGGPGDDRLVGGAGADRLLGGPGRDVLDGRTERARPTRGTA